MRRKRVRRAVVFALLVVSSAFLGTRPGYGQSSKSQWEALPDSVRKNAVQVWGGYSPGSVKLFGVIQGARFGTGGIRYLRIMGRSTEGNRLLEYVADVLPFTAMTYDPVRGAPDLAKQRGEHTLYGLGITPLGLRLRGPIGHRWQPYVESGLGFVYFRDPLPDRRGEPFNFIFQVGVGVRLQAGPTAFTLGYRFHHLSNGFRGQINPGFDSNIFHLGVTLVQF